MQKALYSAKMFFNAIRIELVLSCSLAIGSLGQASIFNEPDQ